MYVYNQHEIYNIVIDSPGGELNRLWLSELIYSILWFTLIGAVIDSVSRFTVYRRDLPSRRWFLLTHTRFCVRANAITMARYEALSRYRHCYDVNINTITLFPYTPHAVLQPLFFTYRCLCFECRGLSGLNRLSQ